MSAGQGGEKHTPSNAMHFVLQEEIGQWDQKAEEGSSEDLPVLQGCWMSRGQGKTSQRPWDSSH